jgi:type I restriction enzyme S subunit
LRFPEFEREWEEKTFNDICSITTGNKNTQDKIENGTYPFYVRSETIERIDSHTFDGEAILTAGDGVGVGKIFHYVNGKIGVHQRVYILSDFKCCTKYAYYYFSSKFYDRVKRMSAKNSVDSVRRDMIAQMPISIPNQREQEKIASLLSLIDERISTQNKIIEEYKKLKTALVDGLYSSNNNKPRLRYQEFQDHWQQYTYSDLLRISTARNVDYSINRILSASQTHGMIERDEIEIDIKFEQETTRTYKIVQPGDYIIHLRSFQGGFAFSNKEGICSPAYSVLRPSDLIRYGFMKDYFISNKFVKMLKIVTYGIRDGRSINVEEFLKLTITIPSIDEQQKISITLATLNNKIQTESRIYSLLVKQKQYLLKRMFI